jgi:hypothetical protein
MTLDTAALLEDLKKGLGLGLVSKVLGLGLDKIVLVLAVL